MNIPTNRLVAFAGPYISLIAGGLATFLAGHHVLDIFGATQSQASTTIQSGLVFLVSSSVVWAGHHKWLTGWIAHEERILNVNLLKPGDSQPTVPPSKPADETKPTS